MRPKNYNLLSLCIALFILITACSFTGLPGGQSDELRSLEHVTWVLISYGPEGKLTPALPQPQITLKFDFSERVASGSAGCNHYSASFSLRNTNILIEEAMSTLMACLDNQAMQQETEFMTLISQVVSYQVENDSLVLFTENGEILQFMNR